MKHHKRAGKFDAVDLSLRNRTGQDGAAICFLADLADVTLDHLALKANVFDLGQIGFSVFLDGANEAHVVYNIYTTTTRPQQSARRQLAASKTSAITVLFKTQSRSPKM